jgi:hypothetical protein
MGGGLLQLVAYGAQDAYLSGNPQITFWKGLFKRHTNFAMEPFRINFNGQPSWGTKQTAIVGRHADLLFSTYVEVQLPTLDTKNVNALWNHGAASGAGTGLLGGALGYNLIEYVELDIGGQIIDKQYSEFMYIWSQLTSEYVASNKLGKMLNGELNTSSLEFPASVGCTTGQGRPSMPNTLYIPLMFFFTRNPGAALPLISLQYHEVKINVQWNDKQVIAGNFTGSSIANLPNATSAALYIDYIYLDTEERRRMAQASHEYLIEQTQYNQDVGISAPNNRVDLTFNHPVKELIWVVQPNAYTNCKASSAVANSVGRPADRLTPFRYDKNAIYEQWLQINGQDRLDRRYGDYYNKVQPYQHHTGQAPGAGVYMYSFAVKPEEHQPSGTCNFSRIDTATIVMNFDGSQTVDADDDKTWDVRVYAVNYNILRVMSGMAGLAYSN